MTLLQLQYFQTVCRYKSISKASEFLHVSQPTISIAINNLESEFGVMLFHRANKRIELTEEGQTLLSLVDSFLDMAESIRNQMHNLITNNRVLKLSMTPLGNKNYFPSVFKKFRELYPDVHIIVTEHNAQMAAQKIRDNQIDIAITVATTERISDVEGYVLYTTPSVFCVGPGHPLATWSKCRFSDLQNQTFVLSNEEAYLTSCVKERFKEMGVTPTVSLYSSQYSLIREILAFGHDGAILTEQTASNIDGVIRIPMEDPIEISPIMVWKKRSQIPTNIKNYVKLMRTFYPDMIPY